MEGREDEDLPSTAEGDLAEATSLQTDSDESASVGDSGVASSNSSYVLAS